MSAGEKIDYIDAVKEIARLTFTLWYSRESMESGELYHGFSFVKVLQRISFSIAITRSSRGMGIYRVWAVIPGRVWVILRCFVYTPAFPVSLKRARTNYELSLSTALETVLGSLKQRFLPTRKLDFAVREKHAKARPHCTIN